jgi:hypothetical protein
MRTLVLALGLATIATPVLAQTIPAAAARAHAGATVTVEGTVGDVHAARSGKVTFIDIGGRYPKNPLTAVIFAADAAKFPDLPKLVGKTVDVTGAIRLYKGQPEIVLTSRDQIKAK